MKSLLGQLRREFKETPFLASLAVVVPLSLVFLALIVYGHIENQDDENTSTGTEIMAPSNEGPIYFISGDSYGTACPQDKKVDWDVAIVALSKHAHENPNLPDDGPAEIERHFEQSCSEDMKIYNAFVTDYPDLVSITKTFKCPSDYASPQDYVDAAAKFVALYKKVLPDASNDDISQYRQSLLLSHNCSSGTPS